jgi:hypothetical protein
MNCQNVRSVIDTATRRVPLGESVNTHLSGCRDCRRHADETSALLVLLSAQPRVEAPADFGFKLRARIAKVEAEPRSPWGTLEKFWTRSFSFSLGQAITATATLALVAAFTAIHFNQSDQPIATTPDNPTVAISTPLESQNRQPAMTGTQSMPSAPEIALTAVKPASVRLTARSNKTSSAPVKSIAVEAPRGQINLASNSAKHEDTWHAYNRERGQMVTAPARSVVIGAENSSSTMAKTVAFVPSI